MRPASPCCHRAPAAGCRHRTPPQRPQRRPAERSDQRVLTPHPFVTQTSIAELRKIEAGCDRLTAKFTGSIGGVGGIALDLTTVASLMRISLTPGFARPARTSS